MPKHTVPTGFCGDPPPGPAMPVKLSAHVDPIAARTPVAIARATGKETAPIARSCESATPKSPTFTEFEYATTDPTKTSETPACDVSKDDSNPPVQLSANAIVSPRARRAETTFSTNAESERIASSTQPMCFA